METVNLTDKVKNLIRFGLIGLLILSGAIGYGVFQHYHAPTILKIEGAKVTSNIISAHAMTGGKIIELPFADGDEVKAGDVIAKMEVSITESDIKKLEDALAAAKKNYETLKQGQRVKTPVRRTRPATNNQASTPRTNNSASIATLEERARRMDELFEMGAVSSAERDKAHQDLNKARNSAPAPATSNQNQTVEIDFVESIQPTPPAILQSAENAVKQAEMALNSALEQSHQTEITAPADGVIYYNYLVDEEIQAGDAVAKIGDAQNIWIEAEVTEDIFNQVPLGKKISYTIDNHDLSGTLIEKISPTPQTEVENPEVENSEPKFVFRISIPAERDFDLKLLSETTLKINL